MFWTKQIPKILQARPRKFTGEGLEKMQHCVQGQATSPTTGLVSGGQFLAHLPNSFCTSIKNLKIFFNPKSTSNKPMPCKIRQSSMKYTGSLDYWDEWLIDQFISLFFFINLQKQKVLCALKIMKKKMLGTSSDFWFVTTQGIILKIVGFQLCFMRTVSLSNVVEAMLDCIDRILTTMS